MDNIFEYIIPIAFAAIYLFGNKLSEKTKEVFDQQSEDTDLEDRQRRIQEEIRRKIMERREESEEQAEAWSAPVRRSDASSSSPTNTFPDTGDGVDLPEPKAESVTSSSDTFASQLEARLEKVEATTRQAEKLKKQGQIATSSNSQSGSKSRTDVLLSGNVRSSLRDPSAARAAFIYGEVLGAPVSLKKVSNIPGLC
ncbi:MAG: hypothetical protein VXU48_02350 [Verrucomicrobiota bacterium]|nr:hypothetical protein [Verrucomicrobiota bacterium]MEC8333579.1 hypothetical protein [Verrucomicrobiota bacterium]